MKGFLVGVLLTLAVLALAVAWVWHYAPETLPESVRRDNPNSRDFAPAVYRWKNDQGVVQLTDTPPSDRPYETVRIDPDRNIVPSFGSPPSGE